MAETFKKIFSGQEIQPSLSVEIRPPRSWPDFAEELPVGSGNCCVPYSNHAGNSRSVQDVSPDGWSVRCSGAIAPGTKPKHILHCSERVIIQGDGPWQMFGPDCKMLDSGYLFGSGVLIDESSERFYFVDSVGMLEARRLADGDYLFSASLLFGKAFVRTFLAAFDDRIVAVSTEREMDQDAVEKPETSTLEAIRFAVPEVITEDGILRSTQTVARLKRKTLTLIAASQADRLVLATENELDIFGLDLDWRAAMTSPMEPIAISLSNDGTVFLVVSDGGALKLRAITQKGERLYSVVLPGDFVYEGHPPIIGYDRCVYLFGGRRLMVFGPNGVWEWGFESLARIGGAVVTPNNSLLISSGDELAMFDEAGRYRLILEFEGDILVTAPTITADGDILVASETKLYCLKR